MPRSHARSTLVAAFHRISAPLQSLDLEAALKRAGQLYDRRRRRREGE
jgi:hypothetical protein